MHLREQWQEMVAWACYSLEALVGWTCKVLEWGTSLVGGSYSLLAEKDGGPCKEAGVSTPVGLPLTLCLCLDVRILASLLS